MTNSVGCDSAAKLVLNIKSNSISNTSITACSNYVWNGTTYNASGTYTYHTLNSVGCDSTATLVLTINQPSTSSRIITACSNYVWNGTTYTASGTYTFHTLNSVGCDSTATLVLTINQPSTSSTIITACSNYVWNGTTYTASGTYTYHTLNSVGCDSTATLVLTINQPSTSSTIITACSNYVWNGTTYNASGTYTYHTLNSVGCDSTATLVLTINQPSTSSRIITACSNYVWNGTTYTASGTYTYHTLNSVGCDSTATLVLTINQPTYSTTNVCICNGGYYTFNGTTHIAAGTYIAHLINSVGCDSLATLILKVKATSISTTIASICNGGSYTFNGSIYTTAGTYVAHLTNSVGCDSAATLVLSVKSNSTSTTTAIICDGSSYTFNGTPYTTAGTYVVHLINSVGCDSAATLLLTVKSLSSSTTTASICIGSSYSFNGSTYNTAGTYVVHLTNAIGCDSAATLILTVNQQPKYVPIITGNTVVCSGDTVKLADSIKGGIWISTDTSIASVDTAGNVKGIKDGNDTICYVVSITGCIDTISVPFTVSCGYVTSGSTGGLESKSIGAAIGIRNFNLYKNGKNGEVTYTDADRITAPKRGSFATMGISNVNSLAFVMPYSVNRNYVQYDESNAVTDLTSITNAVNVRAIDFTLNNRPKAVAFATKTVGNIYSHTKPICDRLKGGEVLNIENIKIEGFTFMLYNILQPNGDNEYAISFTAGLRSGRKSFSLQSNWMMSNYIGEDTMVNYQLWAASTSDLTTMVNEVLGRLQSIMPVQQFGSSNDLPDAYVSAISRDAAKMNLTINNTSVNTSGYFVLTQRENEVNPNGTTLVVPFTAAANDKTIITIPVNDSYDANITMVFNNKTVDMLYIADGIWGTSSDDKTTVSQFNVINNNRQHDSTEYPLLRDVQVQVTTPSYLTIYKYLKGGAVSANLSEYKTLKFTTATNTSGLNLRVTITKKSITNWNSQYSYLITGFQDGQQYHLSLNQFKTTDSTFPTLMDMSDITSVVYNIEVPSGQATTFTAGISNAAFTKEDLVYETSLQVKAVSIFPNPSNGNFKISFESPAATQLHLSVIDINGRLVSSQVFNAIISKNEVAVSIPQSIFSGVYYVTLQGEGVKYTTQKVLIKK